MVLQLLQERVAWPGVAKQLFNKRKRRWRGRGPGRRAGLAGVAHTGSTAPMPGESPGVRRLSATVL